MTILPPHFQRDARNLATASLSMLAFRFQCEVADILALLNQQPSAPSRPKAAAASTPPVGAEAEEVAAPVSSADHSPVQAAESAPDRGSATTPKEMASDEGESNSCPSARRHSSPDNRDGALAADLGTSPREDGASPSLQPDPPSKRITQRQRVRECHEAHPDWTAQQVADDLGLAKTNVQSVASQIGIKWDGKKTSTTEALKQAVKAATPRASVPALPIAKSLKDRVRETLTAHPTWTAAQIANHIGHSVTSVSTTLANVRREAAAPAPGAPPQFSGRREMVEHYGAIAKRLGKPS